MSKSKRTQEELFPLFKDFIDAGCSFKETAAKQNIGVHVLSGYFTRWNKEFFKQFPDYEKKYNKTKFGVEDLSELTERFHPPLMSTHVAKLAPYSEEQPDAPHPFRQTECSNCSRLEKKCNDLLLVNLELRKQENSLMNKAMQTEEELKDLLHENQELKEERDKQGVKIAEYQMANECLHRRIEQSEKTLNAFIKLACEKLL